MAQTINLRQTEYDTIKSELSTMHTNVSQCVEYVSMKMKIMVLCDDVFHANHTSKKIQDMLDMLKEDVMALLEQAFIDSETGVANMIDSIMTTDSI